LNEMMRLGVAVVIGMGAVGCGGDDAVERGRSSTTTGSAGGGAASSTSQGGGATTSGGGGGGMGGAGTGGGAPAPLPCLAESAYSDAFSLNVPDHCVVARYGSDGHDLYPLSLDHGGLFSFDDPLGDLTIERLAVPKGPSGMITLAGVVGPLNAGAEFQTGWLWAHGLPNTPWTLFANSGGGFANGHFWDSLLAFDGTQRVHRWRVVHLTATLGITDGTTSRLLYGGQSELLPFTQALTVAPGLWAADFDAANPAAPTSMHLVDSVAPEAINRLAHDRRGAVFARASEVGVFDTKLLAWPANAVAPAQGGTASHSVLAMLPGQSLLSSDLCAMTLDSDQGLVLYQPYHVGTSTLGDIMMQRYDASGATITPIGTPATAIAPTQSDDAGSLQMVTDPDGNLWLVVGSSIFLITPEP